MTDPTPEEWLKTILQEKYPDDSEEDAQERFELVNERRLYLVRHSGQTCSSCDYFKPFNEFGIDTHNPNGLRAVCKECRNTNTKEGNDNG